MIKLFVNSKGVILADYGPVWREHRRFALMTLRNFGLGKQTMEERILGELSYVIAKLDQCVGMNYIYLQTSDFSILILYQLCSTVISNI